MKPEVKMRLDEIFAKRQSRQDAADDARRKAEAAATDFLDGFKKACALEVRPLMEEMRTYVGQHGLTWRIHEIAEGAADQAKAASRQAIAFAFIPGSEQVLRVTQYPHYSFTCDKDAQKVALFRSTMAPGTGGMAGADGQIDLTQLTGAFVEEKLLRLIEELVG